VKRVVSAGAGNRVDVFGAAKSTGASYVKRAVSAGAGNRVDFVPRMPEF
jgi:hypothetical protein